MSRRLSLVAVVAVAMASAAGAAPGGICPCPAPKPGQASRTSFPHTVSLSAEHAAEAPDGSVVVVGAFGASWTDYQAYSERGLVVARFRADGSVDPSFGVAGVRRDTALKPGGGTRVTIDGTGRVLVAGWEGHVPFVARYRANGDRDATFGTSGMARGRAAPSDSTPRMLAVRSLSDGTVVVVRSVQQPTLTDTPAPGGLMIVRLRSDGSQLAAVTRSSPEWILDGERAYAAWAGAAIRADGSVIVAGSAADPVPFRRPCPCEAHQIFVVRAFAANGEPDRAFGAGGRATARVGTDAYASDVALTGDGSAVVVGASGPAGGSFGAARFLPDGSLDRSFGTGGALALQTGEGGAAERVAVEPDGGIVLAGRPPLTVVRLDRGGRLIGSFGAGGRVTQSGFGYMPVAVFAAPDGGARLVTTSVDARIRLLRLGPTGQSTAATEVTTALASRGAYAAASLRGGGVALAGWINTGRRVAAHLARTGSISESRFGNKGRVTLALGDRTEATAVAESADGSILAAGVVENGDRRRWFVARFGRTGSLDRGFGTGGVARPLPPSGDASVTAVAPLVDGRSELVGWNDGTPVLVRLDRDGAVDRDFGDRGVLRLPLDDAAGLVVLTDGRAVVGGTAGGMLVALGVDAAGRLTSRTMAPVGAHATGVAVQRDGAVLVAGTSAAGIVVARWGAGGTLDTMFGTNGVATYEGFNAFGIGVQRDGRIVVLANDRRAPCLCLVRFLHSGRVDPSFATDGVSHGLSGAQPSALAIVSFVLYAAGTAPTSTGTDLALSAFHPASLVEPAGIGVDVVRVSLPGNDTTAVREATHPSVSPDGRRLSYIRDDDAAPALFVADAGGRHGRRLTRSPAADGSMLASAPPVWSRDGRWLALDTIDEEGNRQISAIRSDGEGLRVVALGTSATWGPGRLLAYAAAGEVHILDLDSGETRVIGRGSRVSWSPRGDLLVIDSTLVRPDGTSVGTLPPLSTLAWKPDGTALAGIAQQKLVAVDVESLRQRTIVTVGEEARSPAWSRDGRWIAFLGRRGAYQLVIVDARTGRRVVGWRPGDAYAFARTSPVWGPAGVYVGISP